MGDDTKAERYKGGSEQYLRQTEDRFLISPSSGLYYPKGPYGRQEVNLTLGEDVSRLATRPHRSREDIIGNFISAVSLLIAVFTLLGLGFTVYFASRQWREMRNATEATRDAVCVANQTLVEAQRNNTVQERLNRESLAASVDTLHKSQRPWVNAESFEATGVLLPPEGMFSISGKLTLKNTGTSVADNGWVAMVALPNKPSVLKDKWDEACERVAASQEASRLAARKHLGDEWPIGFVLAPEQETAVPIGMNRDFSPPDISDGFYLAGCAKYTDQFMRTHTTRFCFMPDTIVYHGAADWMAHKFKFKICNFLETAD